MAAPEHPGRGPGSEKNLYLPLMTLMFYPRQAILGQSFGERWSMSAGGFSAHAFNQGPCSPGFAPIVSALLRILFYEPDR